MSEKPLVSVVIVFQNTRDFIDEAIISVFRQTFTDWELLLVDDGSTDGSDEVARRYAVEYPDRVRYLHHAGRENRGISATRNLGISSARGRYIASLDSDDVWLPQLLERQVEFAGAHPGAAMIYGPVQRWYSWTGKPEDNARDFVAKPLHEYDVLVDPPALVPIILQRQYAVPLGFLIDREAAQAVGAYEDEFRGMNDDQVFLCKLCLRYPVFIMSDWGYRYRRHPNSIVWVTNSGGERLANRAVFLEWLTAYLKEQKIEDPQVWKAVRSELWKCRYPRFVEQRERIEYWGNRVRRRFKRMWSESAMNNSWKDGVP
ncbi:MAG: glycosyltransferase family 2 protein [Gemmatimonadetes bacterium]|nr:glycosyltransferase family 2 protein [Gemmatimonadota bacterium]